VAGVVPVIPFCTVQDPGSGRIQRTVPAFSQPECWHWDEDKVAAMPGVAAARLNTPANARRRTHVGQRCATFTTSLRAFPRLP